MGTNVNTKPSTYCKIVAIASQFKEKGLKVVNKNEKSNEGSSDRLIAKAHNNRIIQKDNGFIRAVVVLSDNGKKKLKGISRVSDELKDKVRALFSKNVSKDR